MYWAIEKSKQTLTQTHCNREPLHQQKTNILSHSCFPIRAQCFCWKSDTHVHSWFVTCLVCCCQLMNVNSHWKTLPIFILHLFTCRLLHFPLYWSADHLGFQPFSHQNLTLNASLSGYLSYHFLFRYCWVGVTYKLAQAKPKYPTKSTKSEQPFKQSAFITTSCSDLW